MGYSCQANELNIVKYDESLIYKRMYSVEIKPDIFPLLLKEGKLIYAVLHSSPKLRLTAMPPSAGGEHTIFSMSHSGTWETNYL